MRISQIKTLCWAGNVLVLAGAGYVGLHFWETLQARGAVPEAAWPEDAKVEAIEKRWPGPVTEFKEIWETPLNGEKPKPPEKTVVDPPKLNRVEKFLREHSCSTVLFVTGSTEDSVAFVRGPGMKEDDTLRTGEQLGGFTLIGFERNEKGIPVLVFAHPEESELARIVRSSTPVPDVFGDVQPFTPLERNKLVNRPVERNSIPRRAYQDLLADPSGLTWFVPAEEMEWWQKFGEEEVYGKLVVNVAEDAAGNPRGIRLMSAPGQGTPVATGRGLNQGDIVVSVNDVPVRGKEDVLSYLRGDGAGLSRYEVLVESESGLQRTVVYNVDRRGRTTVER